MLLKVFQGLHGGHFDFYKLVGNFGIYKIDCVSHEKIKKIKKSKTCIHSLFYKEGQHVWQFCNTLFSFVERRLKLTGLVDIVLL